MNGWPFRTCHKRLIITIACALSLGVAALAQTTVNDHGLSGPVALITTYHVQADPEADPQAFSTYRFDTSGRELERLSYSAASDHLTFRYDDQGRLVERTVTTSSGPARVTSYYYTEDDRSMEVWFQANPEAEAALIAFERYDAWGNLLERIDYANNQITSRAYYLHEPKEGGRLVYKLVSETPPLELFYGYSYTRDATLGRERLTERRHYNAEGREVAYERYDEAERLIEAFEDKGENGHERVTIAYDADGHTQTSSTLTREGRRIEGSSRYDRAGRLIRTYYSRTGAGMEEVTYSYDDYGNVLEEVRRESRMPLLGAYEVIDYSYDYDAYGNWIRKTVTTRLFSAERDLLEETSRVQLREINYH